MIPSFCFGRSPIVVSGVEEGNPPLSSDPFPGMAPLPTERRREREGFVRGQTLKPNPDRGGIGVAAVDPTWGDARGLSWPSGTWVGGGPRRLSWATHGHSGLTSRLWRPLSAGVPALLAPSVPPVLAPSNLSTRLGSPSCLSKASSSRSLLTCPLHRRVSPCPGLAGTAGSAQYPLPLIPSQG